MIQQKETKQLLLRCQDLNQVYFGLTGNYFTGLSLESDKKTFY